MQSYLTIDKGKTETVLFKMGLCLWICRDSKILKYVILLDIPIEPNIRLRCGPQINVLNFVSGSII